VVSLALHDNLSDIGARKALRSSRAVAANKKVRVTVGLGREKWRSEFDDENEAAQDCGPERKPLRPHVFLCRSPAGINCAKVRPLPHAWCASYHSSDRDPMLARTLPIRMGVHDAKPRAIISCNSDEPP
jgi:hypothetical protein